MNSKRVTVNLLKKVGEHAQSLDSTTKALRAASLGELRLEDIPKAKARSLNRRKQLCSILCAARRGMLRLMFTWALTTLKSCEVLSRADRDIILAKTKDLVAEGNLFSLRTLVSDGLALQKRQIALLERYDLKELPPAAELHGVARSLRSAGFFWLFNPECETPEASTNDSRSYAKTSGMRRSRRTYLCLRTSSWMRSGIVQRRLIQ